MCNGNPWAARPELVAPLLSVLLLLPLLASFVAAEPPEPPRGADRQELAARGSVTYRVYCQSCHGRGARGDGNLAGYLNSVPADLTRIAAKHKGPFPVDHVYQVIDGRELISERRREMPIWGQALAATEEAAGLPPREIEIKIWGLVYYLESLQRESGEGT